MFLFDGLLKVLDYVDDSILHFLLICIVPFILGAAAAIPIYAISNLFHITLIKGNNNSNSYTSNTAEKDDE